ncbi:MAG: hypothetical protein LM600_06150 [Thaumarchaeota archaeon]|jgi:hypothetical protein|nr:hypothetical protein [Nitrososphaerota archaeon]
MAAGEPWDMIWFLESLEKSEHKKKKKKRSRAMGEECEKYDENEEVMKMIRYLVGSVDPETGT